MDGLIALLIRRPGRILISFGIILLLAVLVTGRLHFQQDIFAVFPQNDRAFRVLRHIITASEGQDTLYLLVQSKENSKVSSDFLETVEALTEDLRTLTIDGEKGFKKVTARKDEAVNIESFDALFKQFIEQPELFLTDQDVEELEKFLNSPGLIDDELKRSLALLSTPGSSRLSRIISQDPLNFRRSLMQKLHKMQSGIAFADGPFMLSPDGSATLVMAIPAFPPNNIEKAKALFEGIGRTDNKYDNLSIGLTGGYAMAAQEEAMLRSDLISAVLGSVLGIALLFLIAYRRLLVLGFILLPLGVGLQLALGVMAIIWGKVHLIAVAFSAVVLGLGIDFAIHIYDRFASERLQGRSVATATEKAIKKTGSAVMVGGLTTLTAFSVLILTGSPVVQQIGWLVTLGLFFCLLTILWALPAGLVWRENRSNSSVIKPFRLLGMDRLGEFVNRRPGMAILASCALVIVAFTGLPRLSFEKDLMSMHPKELESIKVRQKIQENFGSGAKPLLVAWQAQDSSMLWEKGKKIDRVLAQLAETESVADWSSINLLSSGKDVYIEPDTKMLGRVFQKYGLTLDSFPTVPIFLNNIARTSGRNFDICGAPEQYPEFYQRFFMCDQNMIEGIAWVYADDSAVDILQSKVSEVDSDILVISPENALDGLMAKAKSELLTTVSWVTALVFTILLIFFRSISKVILALLPTVLGLLTTMGVMGLLGIKINLINFIIVPILIGIGLDDGIHIIGRYGEQGNIKQTLSSSGRSILLTSLTTCIGFGSLALADYHILAGMGILTIVGVSACFFYSVITLPALLKIKAGNR